MVCTACRTATVLVCCVLCFCAMCSMQERYSAMHLHGVCHILRELQLESGNSFVARKIFSTKERTALCRFSSPFAISHSHSLSPISPINHIPWLSLLCSVLFEGSDCECDLILFCIMIYTLKRCIGGISCY
jgi:hypothetical protein